MKNFKTNSVTRRLCALILSLAFCIGMLGATTAFAAEPSVSENEEYASISAVSPRVTQLMMGYTGDYVTGNKVLGSFTIQRTNPIVTYQMVTIAYSYEDRYHNHNARLVFKSSVDTPSVYINDTLSGTTSLKLTTGVQYTVTIEPGCTSDYMASVSVYY